jgi:hypothetical protein
MLPIKLELLNTRKECASYGGVQCKVTQSLMMSELKQIRILSLKSLVVAFLLPKNKEVL